MKRVLSVSALALTVLLAACGNGQPAVAPTAANASTSAPTAATAPTSAPTAATEPTSAPTAATEPTSAPTAATEPTAAAPAGDAREAILQAQRAQLNGGPFRTTTTIESDSGTITSEGAFVPPDRLRASTTFGETTSETIIIGSTIWTKTGDEWTKTEGGEQAAAILGQIAQDPESQGITISNATLVGPDTVDGEAALVYAYDTSFGEGDSLVTASSKMWVSVASGLPIKLESAGEASGVKSTTVQTLEYDSSIVIEPPTE